jgi:hypothetical protein
MGDVAAGNGGASATTSLGELETTVELSDLIETARTGTLTSLTDVSAQGWSNLHCPLHCTARHTAVMEWTHTHTHMHGTPCPSSDRDARSRASQRDDISFSFLAGFAWLH